VTPDRYRRAAAAADSTFEIRALRPPSSHGALANPARGDPTIASPAVLRR